MGVASLVSLAALLSMEKPRALCTANDEARFDLPNKLTHTNGQSPKGLVPTTR
jgi:hypothetical protein